jgi:hypothetical protein
MEVCYIKGDVESEWRRDRAGWFGFAFLGIFNKPSRKFRFARMLALFVEELARRHRESHPLLATPQIFRVTTFSFGDSQRITDEITTVGLATTRVDFVVSNPEARNGGGRDESCSDRRDVWWTTPPNLMK